MHNWDPRQGENIIELVEGIDDDNDYLSSNI